jgi:DNA-binding MurR/RpiR family transcriptional regulator
MNMHDRIRAKMPELTAAEAAFGEYALAHDDLIYKSITLATEESGIGYGTVIRFCQKLGFAGFQDFKIHLAVDAGTDSAGKDGAEPGWLLRRVETSNRQISATAETIGESSLESAAMELAKARSILIVGVAGSFPVALQLSYLMDRLGLLSRAESDSHLQAIRSSLLAPEDILFAISSSGGTKEIIECASLARNRGAKVIALTNYAKSPLAEKADLVLTTSIWEGALHAEIGTKLPFYFVVELLSSILLRVVPGAEESVRLSSDGVAKRQV